MKAFLVGVGAILFGSCASGGVWMDLTSAVKAGETVNVMHVEAQPSRDYSVTITNLGPLKKDPGEDYTIEVRNGAEGLGRLGPGESRTFLMAGSTRIDLQVRAEGGGTRFEGRIVDRSR
jgi:hypothetical protein